MALRILLAAPAATASLAESDAAAVPKRVASTMVCADQYVLALVPPENIAGISYLGPDPTVSALAQRATSVATLKADAETFLMTDANVVVGGEHGDTKTLATLKRLGVDVLRAPSKNRFPEMFEQLTIIGRQIGAEESSLALVADAEHRLSKLTAEAPRDPLLAAFYHPNGGSAGSGIYVDEVLTAAGFRSLATALGRKGWGRLDLETLVMNPPEAMLIVSYHQPGQRVQNLFMQHPVFQRMKARLRVITFPVAKTACGNWTLVEGAEFLSATRRALVQP
jgi:iron complex transport system substrate-binding protein